MASSLVVVVVAGGSVTAIAVLGRGGVPWSASSVVLNVAAVWPGAAGYITVYPCGQAPPLASNLNFLAGAVVPNAVVAKVGEGGRVCVYTSAATDLVVDVNGYVRPLSPSAEV